MHPYLTYIYDWLMSARLLMGNFKNLPPEIILDILTRLPTESVLECKLVCKPWRHLVGHSSFSQMHLTHLNHHHDPASKLTFLQLTHPARFRTQFHYLEYSENHDQTLIHKIRRIFSKENSIRRINLTLPFERDYHVIGSCNGLICIDPSDDPSVSDYQPAYICNPITKEYVILSKFNRVRNREYYGVYTGFGYLRETNEYKVVSITRLRGEPNFEWVEVYTLGGGDGWRNIREYGFNCSGYYFNRCSGIFASEALYWITTEGKIVAFNLVDEKFYELLTLPRPTTLVANHNFNHFHIEASGGILWCSLNNSYTRKTEVWLLKKIDNQNMIEQEKYLSLTWCENLYYVKSIALMKSGDILIFSYNHLYSYEIKSSCWRKLLNFPTFVSQIVPHMNTLISLKALIGEENVKAMGWKCNIMREEKNMQEAS